MKLASADDGRGFTPRVPPAAWRPPTALAGFDVQGLGEELAETFVENVTGADDAATEHREVITVAEKGGPFVLTTAATEFATGIDASNPDDALREASPP